MQALSLLKGNVVKPCTRRNGATAVRMFVRMFVERKRRHLRRPSDRLLVVPANLQAFRATTSACCAQVPCAACRTRDMQFLGQVAARRQAWLRQQAQLCMATKNLGT